MHQGAIGSAKTSAEIDRINFFVLQGDMPPELKDADVEEADVEADADAAMAAA